MITDRIVQAALDGSRLLPAPLTQDSYPDFQNFSPRTSLDGSKDDSNVITQDLYQDSRTSLDDSREDSHTAPTHPLGQEDHTCVPSMCTDW